MKLATSRHRCGTPLYVTSGNAAASHHLSYPHPIPYMSRSPESGGNVSLVTHLRIHSVFLRLTHRMLLQLATIEQCLAVTPDLESHVIEFDPPYL
jgi:hypothetical protein